MTKGRCSRLFIKVVFICNLVSSVKLEHEGKSQRRTSDLQLALHLVLPEVVDSSAGVSSTVEQTRLTDIQSQHALFVLHQVLWVLADDHVVLHPDDLWLGGGRGWRGGGGHVNRVRVGENGEKVKFSQHLTNIQRIRRIKNEMCVFKDLSPPPLVVGSDRKICFCFEGIKTLCDSFTR